YIGQTIHWQDKSYLGSGVALCEAVKKYGRSKFKRKILKDTVLLLQNSAFVNNVTKGRAGNRLPLICLYGSHFFKSIEAISRMLLAVNGVFIGGFISIAFIAKTEFASWKYIKKRGIKLCFSKISKFLKLSSLADH
ncbi:MAG: hypothetical protein RRZ68_05465, partial [Oscillospiraceae bacterium]